MTLLEEMARLWNVGPTRESHIPRKDGHLDVISPSLLRVPEGWSGVFGASRCGVPTSAMERIWCKPRPAAVGRLPPMALRDSRHSGEPRLSRSADRWATRVDISGGHPSPKPSRAVPKNEEKERVVVCCPFHARIGGRLCARRSMSPRVACRLRLLVPPANCTGNRRRAEHGRRPRKSHVCPPARLPASARGRQRDPHAARG